MVRPQSHFSRHKDERSGVTERTSRCPIHNFSVPVFSQVVNVLRSQLAQLDAMKKERETVEEEVKAVTFDMSTSFLTALSQDGAINEEQLSLSKLDQLYGAYNQRVQATLRTQEELLGQVQVNIYTHTHSL